MNPDLRNDALSTGFRRQQESSCAQNRANSGVTVSFGILGGRVVRIFKGASVGTATQTNQFTLRVNTDVVIQNSN